VTFIESNYNGNAAFILIEEGKIAGEHFVSIGAPVDRDTMFQVASLSKWISAIGVMTLVDDGRLDLDAPVSQYLTRWQLPPSEFDNNGVTVRRLLSHTAGLIDGLGYGGFPPGEDIQPLEASLTQASDASPGADGRVHVGLAPGAGFEYSGGGYSLLQLLVEEVSGQPFETYMQLAVFQPLGMTRSTYGEIDETAPNVAALYDEDGSEAVRYRFAGLAPTGLNTSAADMALLVQMHLQGQDGSAIGRGVLSSRALAQMREPHAFQFGAPIWGLGVILYAPIDDDSFIVGHDGSNEPAINSAVRFDPETGDGIIILETGDKLLATELAGEWVFWNAGTIDLLGLTMVFKKMGVIILVGWGAVMLFAIVLFVKRRRR